MACSTLHLLIVAQYIATVSHAISEIDLGETDQFHPIDFLEILFYRNLIDFLQPAR